MTEINLPDVNIKENTVERNDVGIIVLIQRCLITSDKQLQKDSVSNYFRKHLQNHLRNAIKAKLTDSETVRKVYSEARRLKQDIDSEKTRYFYIFNDVATSVITELENAGTSTGEWKTQLSSLTTEAITWLTTQIFNASDETLENDITLEKFRFLLENGLRNAIKAGNTDAETVRKVYSEARRLLKKGEFAKTYFYNFKNIVSIVNSDLRNAETSTGGWFSLFDFLDTEDEPVVEKQAGQKEPESQESQEERLGDGGGDAAKREEEQPVATLEDVRKEIATARSGAAPAALPKEARVFAVDEAVIVPRDETLPTVPVYGLDVVDDEASAARWRETARDIAEVERRIAEAERAADVYEAAADEEESGITAVNQDLDPGSFPTVDTKSAPTRTVGAETGGGAVRDTAFFDVRAMHEAYWRRRFALATLELPTANDVGADVDTDATRVVAVKRRVDEIVGGIVNAVNAKLQLSAPSDAAAAAPSALNADVPRMSAQTVKNLRVPVPDDASLSLMPVTDDELRSFILRLNNDFFDAGDGNKLRRARALYEFVTVMGGVSFSDDDDQQQFEQQVRSAATAAITKNAPAGADSQGDDVERLQKAKVDAWMEQVRRDLFARRPSPLVDVRDTAGVVDEWLRVVDDVPLWVRGEVLTRASVQAAVGDAVKNVEEDAVLREQRAALVAAASDLALARIHSFMTKRGLRQAPEFRVSELESHRRFFERVATNRMFRDADAVGEPRADEKIKALVRSPLRVWLRELRRTLQTLRRPVVRQRVDVLRAASGDRAQLRVWCRADDFGFEEKNRAKLLRVRFQWYARRRHTAGSGDSDATNKKQIALTAAAATAVVPPDAELVRISRNVQLDAATQRYTDEFTVDAAADGSGEGVYWCVAHVLRREVLPTRRRHLVALGATPLAAVVKIVHPCARCHYLYSEHFDQGDAACVWFYDVQRRSRGARQQAAEALLAAAGAQCRELEQRLERFHEQVAKAEDFSPLMPPAVVVDRGLDLERQLAACRQRLDEQRRLTEARPTRPESTDTVGAFIGRHSSDRAAPDEVSVATALPAAEVRPSRRLHWQYDFAAQLRRIRELLAALLKDNNDDRKLRELVASMEAYNAALLRE